MLPKEHLNASSSLNPLEHASGTFTSKDILVCTVHHKACFAASRRASTLSGHISSILRTSLSSTGNLLSTDAQDTNVLLWGLTTETHSHILLAIKGGFYVLSEAMK